MKHLIGIATLEHLIGIATWNYGWGSLAERIDRFVEMGFNAVSLIARDARAMCSGETPDVADAIRRHSLAVTIHTGFAPQREPLPHDALLADFALFCRWHADTGALLSVNYDAAKIDTPDGTRVYQSAAMGRVLGDMLSMSAGADFSVGVEDWPRDPEQSAFVDHLRAHPHYGVLIDLGHMNMRIPKPGGDGSFSIDAARDYLDRFELPINELHVHNNDGKRDLHAPPTSGTADLTAVAGMLVEKGVNCISTIEIVPAWCGLTEEQGLQAAREALEFWRGVFQEPRSPE